MQRKPACFSAPGIPAIICGPGSIEQAHQPDEWIEIVRRSKKARQFMQPL